MNIKELNNLFRQIKERQNIEFLIGDVLVEIWEHIELYKDDIITAETTYENLEKELASRLTKYLDKSKVPTCDQQ